MIHRHSVTAWCGICQAEVKMLTVDEAASTARTNPMTIYRQAEDGELHYTETGQAVLLICSVSLQDAMQVSKGAGSS
jgi:excisionase family DNA binding protein